MSRAIQCSPIFPSSSEPIIALADSTRQSLIAFRRRRDLLGQCRGLGWGLLVLAVLLLLAILVDALWTHPAAKWGGSIAIYAAAVLSGLRWWLARRKHTDLRVVARQLEQLDPRLRERLLSAVELSDDSPQVVDSAAFRSQLQQQVARLISAVDIRQLLPWQSVQRSLGIGLGSCAFVLLLCLVPNLNLPHRIARIVLPMVDWGRVGRFVITLERPMPHSKTVPRDDIVAITARTNGLAPSSLQLETRTADGTIRTIDMQPLNPRVQTAKTGRLDSTARFEVLLPADVAKINYRVVGQSSSTPWYRLTTVTRPQVTEFEKRIALPAYASTGSGLLPTTVIEPHGDLRVLRGSRVKLLLTIDQPVRSAELQWVASPSSVRTSSDERPIHAASPSQDRPNATGSPLQLQPEPGSQRHVIEVLAEHSASYKIRLQSLNGNIANDFGPTYELTVVDDQAPIVHWLQPLGNGVIATADQVLSLQHEIIDELPLLGVTRSIRVNGSGDWQSVQLKPDSTEMSSEFSVEQPKMLAATHQTEQAEVPSSSGQLLQQISRTQWEFDLLSQNAKPGDYLEVKLSATDLQGKVGDSSVLQIKISSASLTLEAQSPELRRREVRERLVEIANKLTEAKQAFEESTLAQTVDPEVELSVEQSASAQRLAVELRTKIVEAMATAKQAAAEAEDVLSSQALLRTGEILATLRLATSETWEKHLEQSATMNMQNGELTFSQTRQQLEDESNQASELARQFEILSTYDVMGRHGKQIAQLAEAEQLLHHAVEDELQIPAQLQRRQQVLAEQLRITQQAMLESLKYVRQDSRQPLQNSVYQLGQQLETIEQFDAYHDRRALQEMTRSVVEQLSRLQLRSQLDGSLSNAIKVADRRLAEMSPATSAPLLKLADQLASVQPTEKLAVDQQTQHSLAQLSKRRELQLTIADGDRAYAADLGNAQRAVEQLDADVSLRDDSPSEAIREIAGAVGTLQAVHHVEQLKLLVRELLQNERWDDKPSELASHAPRVWDALESRYEQATNALQAAQIPDEIIQAINRARWSPAAQRAGQRLAHRLWNREAPTSAAAEVEQLLDQLTATGDDLAEHAAQARLKLQRYAPTIGRLAEQAAARVESVEKQTQQLADAIERDEVPEVPSRIDELQTQTDTLQTPMKSLREALVDQAESQNLLDRQQLQLARSTDAAIDLVDRVAQRLRASLGENARMPPMSQIPSLLQTAAKQQGESAAALKKLAEHYPRLETARDDEGQAEKSGTELTEQLSVLQNAEQRESHQAEIDEAYQRAQQLADLAEQDPQQVLERLERELPHNAPMSDEMSKLSQQNTREALEQLTLAADQQEQLQVSVEQSDPNFNAQMRLLLHDVVGTSHGALKMLETIFSESKWTAGASQNEDIASRIAQTEEGLRTSIQRAQSVDLHLASGELLAAAADLEANLIAFETVLHTASDDLAQAALKKIHGNEAEITQRRREMLDRQRRIQQQTVRDAQQIEREEQQHLQHVDNELRQAEQQVRQTAEQQQNARRQWEQQPDQQWLQDQIAEREPQLEMARASQKAIKRLRDAIEQRAEQTRQRVEQINSMQPSELKSDNPTADLSAILARQSADESRALADRLRTWLGSQFAQPQASARELGAGYERETEIGNVVAGVAEDLSRSARHEARLHRDSPSRKLAQAALATQAVANQEVKQVTQQFAASKAEAHENHSQTHQASVDATQSVLTDLELTEGAIERAAQSLREILSEQEAAKNNSIDASGKPSVSSSSSPSRPPSPSAAGDSPLDGQQKARLLDELDRQLQHNPAARGNDSEPNTEAQTGATESAEFAAEQENKTLRPTLAEAARRVSQSLTRARQSSKPDDDPSGEQANSPSSLANLKPQFSSTVHVLPVDRHDSQWGQLPEQAADDLLETRRDILDPHYQKQIDAYFRELAEQGRE